MGQCEDWGVGAIPKTFGGLSSGVKEAWLTSFSSWESTSTISLPEHEILWAGLGQIIHSYTGSRECWAPRYGNKLLDFNCTWKVAGPVSEAHKESVHPNT